MVHRSYELVTIGFTNTLGSLEVALQTFMPYQSFEASAAVLDNKRLGKQRIENLQIAMALVDNGGLRGGWKAHPAARMWHGHLAWLVLYQQAICHEWIIVRGFKDTCWEKTLDNLARDLPASRAWNTLSSPVSHSDVPRPWFLDSEALRLTHRDNLVRKAPELYLKHFGPLRSELAYVWTEERARELEEALNFEELPEEFLMPDSTIK